MLAVLTGLTRSFEVGRNDQAPADAENESTPLMQMATEIIRPTCGEYDGFEYATPKNAEVVAYILFSYR